MLSMMDGAAGRRPSLDGRSSLDRRSFDEDGSQPTSPASAAARRLDPLDEVASATTAETLTVQLDRRTLYVLAAIGAGQRSPRPSGRPSRSSSSCPDDSTSSSPSALCMPAIRDIRRRYENRLSSHAASADQLSADLVSYRPLAVAAACPAAGQK